MWLKAKGSTLLYFEFVHLCSVWPERQVSGEEALKFVAEASNSKNLGNNALVKQASWPRFKSMTSWAQSKDFAMQIRPRNQSGQLPGKVTDN